MLYYDNLDVILHERFWQATVLAAITSGESLEPDARYYLTQALGAMMSDISEGQYCAGWLIKLEDILPFQLLAACQRGEALDLPFHPDTLDLKVAQMMCAIADVLGHWANREWYPAEVGGGEQYVPYRPNTDNGTLST